MSRFFVEDKRTLTIGDTIYIEGSDAKHISLVLRKTVGTEMEVVCGNAAYLAVISDVSENKVKLVLKQALTVAKEAALNVYLLQGIAKGEKMDLIIQKAVELGVSAIIPVACERSVVQLKGDKAKDKQQRWQKIAESAAKQCGRDKIPQIMPVQGLKAALESLPADIQIIMPWECEVDGSLRQLLLEAAPKNVAIIIGPEGGFSQTEVEIAKTAGSRVVTLGPRILRTETAAISVLSIVMFNWGDIGGSN